MTSTTSSERYLELLRQAQTITPSKLPDNFPFSEFQRNLGKYNEQDSWYTGEKLEEQIEIAGKSVGKYPVKINPIKGTCSRHVAMLFGNITDDDKVLVTPKVVVKQGASDAEKERALLLEDTLLQIWYESNGRDIQLNNGMMAQRYGGCVFYLRYDPNNFRTFPIAIETPNPKFFIGVPNSSNPFDLEEAWIVKPISDIEIQNQGLVPWNILSNIGLQVSFSSDDVHWLCEHYTKRIYEVFIDGKLTARSIILPGTGNSSIVKIGGENKLGIIPIIYIPHATRDVSGFYGENVFDNVTGLVLEMNARMADIGDATSADSHDIIVTRNINGTVKTSQLLPGVARVDIGSGLNVTGQEAQPDAHSLRTSSLLNTAMSEFVKELYKQYRRDAIHPAVCDGEDEGSQRSSQTLTTRMWSLETHADMERIAWTTALNHLSKIIVRMLWVYGNNVGIDQSFENMRIRQSWYPTLKRDRQDIVTEITTRFGAKMLSPQHGIAMFEDIQDIDEELQNIYDFWREMAKIDAEAKAQVVQNMQNQLGSPQAVNVNQNPKFSKKTEPKKGV